MILIRTLFFIQAENAPGYKLFLPPDDQHYYHTKAKQFVEKGWLIEKKNLDRGPGYIYFLGPVYLFSKNPVISVRILQLILGVMTGILIYATGKHLFQKNEPIYALMFYTGYLPIIAYEGALLMTSLNTFLLTAGLCCFIKSLIEEKKAYLILAGLLYGWALIIRPNSAIFPLVLALYLWKREVSIRKGVIFLSFFAVPYLMLIFRNFSAGADLFNISTQGKFVLHSGHFHESMGVGFNISDKAETLLAGMTNGTMAYLRLLLQDISSHFPLWIKMQCFKLFAFFFNYEYPQFLDYYLIREQIAVLKTPHVTFGILSGFSLLGTYLLWSHKEGAWRKWLIIYFFAGIFSIVIFYVIARFRIPLIPVFCLISGYAIQHTRPFFQKLPNTKRLLFILTALFFFISFNLPSVWQKFHQKFTPTSLLNRGIYYMHLGEIENARSDFNRTLQMIHNFRPALNQIGKTYAASGECDTAENYFKNASPDKTLKADQLIDIAQCHDKKKNHNLAITYFENAILKGARGFPVFNRLSKSYLKAGRAPEAMGILKACIQKFPDQYEPYLILGIYYQKNGQEILSRQYLNKARQLKLKSGSGSH